MNQNVFYVYVIGSRFLYIDMLKLSLVENIDYASYWHNKNDALSWNDKIIKKYRNVVLRKASLTIKK